MNTLSLVSIAQLLDGRYFFIPAYQRGYRWSDDQMLELLDDLYEFAVREKGNPLMILRANFIVYNQLLCRK